MDDSTLFDCPASKTFRDYFTHPATRRPTLPPVGRHSDEQALLDYILFLEMQNHQLRAALDLAHLAGKGRSTQPTAPARPKTPPFTVEEL